MSKKIRKLVQNKVENALVDFSKTVSDKKFKKHVKKAGKILSDGLHAPGVVKRKKKLSA